ncbi:hypothetical protein [Anaerolentibacter hominis]|uniref:hypothetical protein n=1 Tax=Anaerolentibacter hominis TaxID=3079009 RepID=UPI0031B84C72
METQKFKRVGSSYLLILFLIGIVLPLTIAVVVCAFAAEIKVETVLMMFVFFGFFVWIILLMMIAWGSLSSPFVKRTAKRLNEYPYQFNSSFKSRGGTLYIDVNKGMLGFISAYNPFEIQIFSASRIDRIKTIASTMTGIRFVFYLDGKKITMPTLISNRMVSTKSGIGAEAVEKADLYVSLLTEAKNNADRSSYGLQM